MSNPAVFVSKRYGRESNAIEATRLGRLRIGGILSRWLRGRHFYAKEVNTTAELMRIALEETREWTKASLDSQAAAPVETAAYMDNLLELGEDEALYGLMDAAPEEGARFFMPMAIVTDIAPSVHHAQRAAILGGSRFRAFRADCKSGHS